MCTIIKHGINPFNYRRCDGFDLIIAGSGLQCGNCLALCECNNKRLFEIEKAKIEKEFEVLPHQYSYPIHQIQALKKKYNINNHA